MSSQMRLTSASDGIAVAFRQFDGDDRHVLMHAAVIAKRAGVDADPVEYQRPKWCGVGADRRNPARRRAHALK